MLHPHRSASAAEIPLDTKFVRAIDGRFVFSGRPTEAGANPVHACRTQSVSPREFVIASRQEAIVGEKVAALFDRLGPINGTVARLFDGGFVVSLTSSEAEKRSLAATIDWLKKQHTNLAEDHRAAPRYRTRGQSCKVSFGEQTIACQLRDISTTGANLSTDTMPPVGTELRIGSVTAQVVRHTGQSFGVRFAEERPVETLLKELLA